ncbi:MAG: DUF1573 domain-containing protein [bacterium]|nr:DUF1573 domain-containing protein [bacterium]
MKKIIVLILLFFLFFIGWWFLPGKTIAPTQNSTPKTSVQNITAAEFDEIIASRDPFVVDVHVPEQAHLSGTDAVIDYQEVKNRLNDFPQDKSAEIIVYCRSGSMSEKAAQDLVNAGYTNVKNLVGGANAYRETHVGVEIRPKTIPLGTVIYGEVGHAEFTLSNNTANPLKITKVTTSCGCTKAEAVKTSLEPYEATKVKVSFDPAVHKDDTDLGEIIRTIYISTDNINFPEIESQITATVVKK